MKTSFKRIDQLLDVQKRLEERPEFRRRKAKNAIAGDHIRKSEALWASIEAAIRRRLLKIGR